MTWPAALNRLVPDAGGVALVVATATLTVKEIR